MTGNELKTKIARVLGVSSSEKELAYEIFLGKISEQLQPNLTLKISEIGFFQIKEENNAGGDTGNSGGDSIVFIPFSSEFSKESENLYLILEVAARKKNSMEFDSSVFSIGVGKPLVPLYNKEEFKDSETSYAILRKSIEERVNELISESSQIENFNMWDGYVESTLKNPAAPNSNEDTLKELTSDLDFDMTHEPDADKNYSGNEEDKTLDDIHMDLLTASRLMEEDLHPFENDEVNDNNESGITEENETATDETAENEITVGETDEAETVSDENKDAEELIDNIKDRIIEENSEKVKEESSWNFDIINEEEEKVEWNWGDGLKEEFGIGSDAVDENKYDIIDEEIELDETVEEEAPGIDLKSTKDLFAELDSTIKKELTSEIKFEPPVRQETRKSTRYDFIEEKLPYDRDDYVPPTLVSSREYARQTGGTGQSYDDRKYSSLSKSIFLVFSAFIIVAAIILYLFVFSKETPVKPGQTAELSANGQNTDEQLPPEIGTAQQATAVTDPVVIPEEDNFPRTATMEVKDKDLLNAKSDILKKNNAPVQENKQTTSVKAKSQPAETKISNSIFYDGSKYNVQISSWRNKLKADQEVARLKKLGYDAFEYEVNLPQKGGIWYRVRVGNFQTKEEAESFLNKKNF